MTKKQAERICYSSPSDRDEKKPFLRDLLSHLGLGISHRFFLEIWQLRLSRLITLHHKLKRNYKQNSWDDIWNQMSNLSTTIANSGFIPVVGLIFLNSRIYLAMQVGLDIWEGFVL